jgi:hypothetical protein
MAQNTTDVLAKYLPVAKKYLRYSDKTRQLQTRIAQLQKLDATDSQEYKKLVASLDGFCSSQDYVNTFTEKEKYDKLLVDLNLGHHIKN